MYNLIINFDYDLSESDDSDISFLTDDSGISFFF